MRILILFTFLLAALTATAQKDFYTQQWSEVYKHEIKGLPKSALEAVDTIYSTAKKQGNITELTKALLYQSKFAVILEENSELVAVEKFKKEISESNPPLQNVLQAMLAHVYWQYFKHYSWKYFERSRTSEKANPDDFRTWDANAMLAEIDRHYQNSLAGDNLKATRLEAFDDILALAENSKKYRPTLFDFLANNALDFYTAQPTLHYGWRNSGPARNADTNTSDSLSKDLQALKIFDELARLHQQRTDTAAYIQIELERLNFVRKRSDSPDDGLVYRNALAALWQKFQRHPASTLIDLELSKRLVEEANTFRAGQDTSNQFKKREALLICDRALKRFPAGDGAAGCATVKEHILTKTVAITMEQAIPVNQPSRVLVEYMNLDRLYFSLYRLPGHFSPRAFNRADDSVLFALIRTLPREHAWSSTLKNLGDYQQHSTEIPVPGLAEGDFIMIASEHPEISDTTEWIFGYERIQVTDIAVLEFVTPDGYRFQVVDRNNGKPLAGADVAIDITNWERYGKTTQQHERTDHNGFVDVKIPRNGRINVSLTVSWNGSKAFFGGYSDNWY
ncbi:MAG TPA: hypothetical protein VEB86_05725, partial [Chryseosolibacter sp.]|nr:hypothetical protein [Chryseosolibacter sp.]